MLPINEYGVKLLSRRGKYVCLNHVSLLPPPLNPADGKARADLGRLDGLTGWAATMKAERRGSGLDWSNKRIDANRSMHIHKAGSSNSDSRDSRERAI